MQEQTHYDLMIVGGGIVGLTLAALLARLRLKIAIIDNQSAIKQEQESAYDLRVSAINFASKNIFESIQAWPEKISPYEQMQVWDAESSGDIQFSCFDLGIPALGYIVENRELQKSLTHVLKSSENVDIFYDTNTQELTRDALDNWLLNTNTKQKLVAPLLIGADGANSWVREQFKIKLTTWPYQQTALVTTVKTELSHEATARQCFLASGPLAFLPLTDPHTCSIVWSTTPTQAEALCALSDAEFNQALAKAFGFRLGKTEVLDKRITFALHMRHAKNYVAPHMALIGDAIHTIHPLAGQGLNLGLMDAACLAQIIEETILKNSSIADFSGLRRYERWRKGENLAMIAAMEGFKRLFVNERMPVKVLRSVGLNMTNKWLWLKKMFMQRAIGLTGDLPKIAKPISK